MEKGFSRTWHVLKKLYSVVLPLVVPHHVTGDHVRASVVHGGRGLVQLSLDVLLARILVRDSLGFPWGGGYWCQPVPDTFVLLEIEWHDK